MNADDTSSTTALKFTQAHRLKSPSDFHAVYNARAVKNAGPLKIQGRPNEISHNRLGISISRRVGNAPIRNQIKRLLREAFRLTQHEQPQSYDIVVVVRKHDPLSLDQYQTHLNQAIQDIDALWQKRSKRQANPDQPKTD